MGGRKNPPKQKLTKEDVYEYKEVKEQGILETHEKYFKALILCLLPLYLDIFSFKLAFMVFFFSFSKMQTTAIGLAWFFLVVSFLLSFESFGFCSLEEFFTGTGAIVFFAALRGMTTKGIIYFADIFFWFSFFLKMSPDLGNFVAISNAVGLVVNKERGGLIVTLGYLPLMVPNGFYTAIVPVAACSNYYVRATFFQTVWKSRRYLWPSFGQSNKI